MESTIKDMYEDKLKNKLGASMTYSVWKAIKKTCHTSLFDVSLRQPMASEAAWGFLFIFMNRNYQEALGFQMVETFLNLFCSLCKLLPILLTYFDIFDVWKRILAFCSKMEPDEFAKALCE